MRCRQKRPNLSFFDFEAIEAPPLCIQSITLLFLLKIYDVFDLIHEIGYLIIHFNANYIQYSCDNLMNIYNFHTKKILSKRLN